MKFEPGWYYVGDPCYAISDSDDWSAFCDEPFNYNEGSENEMNFRGHPVWATCVPEDEFHDNEGREYLVDAVMLGVLPTALITPEPEDEASDPPKVDGGHVFYFEKPFEVTRDERYIYVGHLMIDTDPPSIYDERYDDEDEDDPW